MQMDYMHVKHVVPGSSPGGSKYGAIAQRWSARFHQYLVVAIFNKAEWGNSAVEQVRLAAFAEIRGLFIPRFQQISEPATFNRDSHFV